jgi:phosphoribosylaminoimidazolecarboxamide formyltransferase/IMP cyclohydrolase
MTIRRALLSVYDKTGLVEFASALGGAGVELVASGGTADHLSRAGLSVTPVEDLTGLPAILGGRVKTLHPAIHAAILARDTADDQATLEVQGWGPIDLVVVNLYPFVETVSRPGVTDAEAIEQIDIGGVALLRAAAKNHARVTVVVDPADYGQVVEAAARGEDVPADLRRQLAYKAFAHTAAYDVAIANYLTPDAGLPPTLAVALPQAQTLRYGENPHQAAALYALPGIGPLGGELLQGKPLSYNNLLDLDAAWRCASSFRADGTPTAVIVKHLNPTGVAQAETLASAFEAALASDPVSAFGGVIASSVPFDRQAAEALGDLFVEAIAAPGFDRGAREVLASRQDCRLLVMGDLAEARFEVRSVRGGLLAQTLDLGDEAEWRVVTQRQPTEAEMHALRFAWRAVAHVKSNAIVFAQGSATVGIGGGLPSRVDAVRLAATKAGERARGAVMASDAFFPFPDGVEVAAEAGVMAVVEPGGSLRDEQVIQAADRLGLAMCFTGVRHFRH